MVGVAVGTLEGRTITIDGKTFDGEPRGRAGARELALD